MSGSPTTLRIQGMRLAGTQPPNGVVRYVDAYGACRVVRPGQVLAEDFVFTAAERAVWLTTRGSTEAFLGGVECELRVTNLSDPPGDWAQIGTVEASGSGDLTWSWEWKDWDRHREERVHLRLRRVSNQGADVARTRTVEIQAYGEDFRPFRGEVAVEVSLLDVDDPTAYGDSTINLVDPTTGASLITAAWSQRRIFGTNDQGRLVFGVFVSPWSAGVRNLRIRPVVYVNAPGGIPNPGVEPAYVASQGFEVRMTFAV